MLPKKYRLTKKEEFASVGKKGAQYNGRFFVLKAVKTEQLASRAGVVVSVGISKKAVERNRIKRVVREKVQDFVKHTHGWALVFFARREAAGATRSDLAGDALFLLKKLGGKDDS